MIVFIFGNIGSGKSTIINKILEKVDCKYYAIDEFRRVYSDGTLEGEELAKKMFMSSITLSKVTIIESLGVGKLNRLLYDKFRHSTVRKVVIVLYVPVNICLKRIKDKRWLSIPFPQEFGMAKTIIRSTNQRLYIQREYLKWSQTPNSTVELRDNISEIDQDNTLSYLLNIINDSRGTDGA